tara:strand:+ start:2311 stop:3267 length:957 start_codon:yes stop_codon:yes gene_type:complete
MNTSQVNFMFIFVLSVIMFKLYNTDNFSDVPDAIIPSIPEDQSKKTINRPPRVIKRNNSKRSVECSAITSATYYGMRPIIQYNEYENVIKDILLRITKPIEFDYSEFKHPMRFLQTNDEENLMKFIMARINEAYRENPNNEKYALEDTWDGEHFSYLNQKVYSFSDKKIEGKKFPKEIRYVINFSLFNNHRYSSNDIIVEILKLEDVYHIMSAVLGTYDVKTDVVGVGINKSIDSSSIEEPGNPPHWLYGDTVEDITFNKYGFYEEGQNYTIKGGVPESLNDQLEEYSDKFLPEVSHAPILPKNYKTVQLRGFKVESV